MLGCVSCAYGRTVTASAGFGGEVELGDEPEDPRRRRECPATARPVRQVNGPGVAVEMNSEPARRCTAGRYLGHDGASDPHAAWRRSSVTT